MKKIIGLIMLAIPIIGVVIFCLEMIGLKYTFYMYGSIAILSIWLYVAIYFLTEN